MIANYFNTDQSQHAYRGRLSDYYAFTFKYFSYILYIDLSAFFFVIFDLFKRCDRISIQILFFCEVIFFGILLRFTSCGNINIHNHFIFSFYIAILIML